MFPIHNFCESIYKELEISEKKRNNSSGGYHVLSSAKLLRYSGRRKPFPLHPSWYLKATHYMFST